MYRNRYPLFCAVILIIFFVIGFSTSAFNWNIEVLESQGDCDTSAPVVLDSNDTPHTAYFKDTYENSASIFHAYRSEGSWTKQTAAVHEAEIGNSSHPVLALDANDNPYICYRGKSGQLSYIYWAGSDWSDGITIDSDNRCSPHGAIFDGNDMMNVVYIYYMPPDDREHSQLRLAVDTGDGFDKTVIEPNGYYLSPSIALDSNDNPHVSYYDKINSSLVYAVREDGSWTPQKVENVSGISSSIHSAISLTLDSNDFPHITYHHFADANLKYAYWNGSDWIIQTIDNPNNVGKYSSLVLDSDDHPHIAYQHTTNSILKYATFNGSSWQIEMVDDANSSSLYASLALDSYDRPRISHFDSYPNYDIRYASVSPTCGDLEHPLLPGDIDENCYIDFNDFSRFASWWLISNCADSNDCQGRDFDQTGKVDANDLSTFCSNWLRYTGL